ncbi:MULTISPECIES: DUF983 domain-containing protein [unclassified Rhizobium]|uniref:DUF983 domain-containing protein n=1 Tax=unclassified Rhizobium TaxID=2613769 RepID=UPI001621865C|nr:MULTISPECIES: DUF983 domain-containing protein [unclassified Rhizobium]MBB3539375.1 uncharacterized protein (DUF983 family) [Rhizobium sp. BK399]MCS3741235.1 uncharacterized protein (DUF983 family) [Rhizobium sp. BK661]MCS4093399.1 uncharacterized protein (DUF983 family) [Rhizobium sp. BK176]
MTTTSSDQPIRYGSSEEVERPLGRSIKRGMLNTCPNCGSGKLFKSFLKPVDNCAACGEAMYHHRADDLPPYLAIVIIGHLIIGGYMATDLVWPMPLWLTFTIWAPITVLAALLVIQPIKGGVIGLQWAQRMHGFGGHGDDEEYEIPGRNR